MRLTITTFLALFALPLPAYAAPTQTQLCESAMELASAKYAQCRLNAESKYSKTLDGAKRTSAVEKCSAKLSAAFTKATLRYGTSCAATENSSAFDEYLTQCSDDTAAAAAGATLPDYVDDLASCNVDLTACDGALTTCTGDLATCTGDLAACEALPKASVLKTGQTTNYGAGSDGDLQLGIAQNYTDNGDGTITDTRTGLMWEKKSDDGSIHDKDDTYDWGMVSPPYTMNGTMVTTFLAALNSGSGFAGYTDWRIPNIKELETIAVFENTVFLNYATPPAFNTNCNPGCSVTTCSCIIPDRYWSSTTEAHNPFNAWNVYFLTGELPTSNKNNLRFVRAVRTS